MTLAPLAIDEANDTWDRTWGKMLCEKYVQTIDESGHDDVFSAECFDIGDLCGGLCRHSGPLALLANAGARSKLGLRHSRTIHSHGYARSLQFVL